MTDATVRAYPNIALVKYWGKRDETLMLPLAGSVSMTLDAFPTDTTVELVPGASDDSLILNGAEATPEALRRIVRVLDIVRERAGTDARARVTTRNAAPTGAGLASSASGFAALATAASAAYGLNLDEKGLSRLARRGSGSAARSIIPGMAVWHAGDDEASYAERIDAPEIRMVVVIVDQKHKAVSSREAMRRTALTSPYHQAWIDTTEESLAAMLDACAEGDFTRIGRIAESHALRMHAHIQSAEPPIRYLAPGSIAVFDAIERMRAEGLETYATADAGPNVVAITKPEDVEAVARELAPLGRVVITGPGPGASLTDGMLPAEPELLA